MLLPCELPGKLTRCCFLGGCPVLALEANDKGEVLIIHRAKERWVHWRLLEAEADSPSPARAHLRRQERQMVDPELNIWAVAKQSELLGLERFAIANNLPIPENGQKRLAIWKAQPNPETRQRIYGRKRRASAPDQKGTHQVSTPAPTPAPPALKPRSQAQRDADLEMRLTHLGEHPCPVVRRGWRYVQQLKAEAMAAA